MTFKEALKKLGKLANGEYHLLRFETIIYHTGDKKIEISGYVNDRGWTGTHNNYDDVLSSMEKRIVEKENSESPGEDIQKQEPDEQDEEE
jgi:hypothetical protein